MKVTTIEWKEQTDGDYVVCCPFCGSQWKNTAEPDYKLCPCVRFMWSDDSILNSGKLMFHGDWDTKSFEKAYRTAHWETYHDPVIITTELDSLERGVLSSVACPDIDEIAELQECKLDRIPTWTTTFLGLKDPRPTEEQERPEQIANSVEQPPSAPEWAMAFISQKFDPDLARAAGWRDQDSARADFGVTPGRSVWIYEIDGTSGCNCHCPHVCWGFLFVKLAKGNRIAAIRTEVYEAFLFPDGHAEILCTDFMGADVVMGRGALEAATGSVEVMSQHGWIGIG
jgi:hypothetical protein